MKATLDEKIKTIRKSIGQNYLDNQYLNLLIRALEEEHQSTRDNAQVRINDWYNEVLWRVK